MSNQNTVIEKQSLFTVKKILRVLSLLCIVFVFCPSFLVSCSGQVIEVDVMTAVEGLSMYGETVVEPHPIMLICLLLPITILILLFVKKFSESKVAAIISGCAIIDLVIWLIFRITVKEMAEENGCMFETTPWYVMNVILLILMISMSVLVFIKKLEMNSELISIFSGGAATNIKNRKIIGYCYKCGNAIEYGCKFCTTCGTAVPEGMLVEVKKETKEKANAEVDSMNERNAFCVKCGAKLEADAIFCEMCGGKIE